MTLKADEVKLVGIVGAGTMGSGIAQVVASRGIAVAMLDISEEAVDKGKAAIAKGLARLVKKEKMTQKDAESLLGRISTTTDYKDFADCDLVIEAIVENLDIKKQTFEQIEANVRPDIVLATNTSSLPVIEIAVNTRRPEKIVGLHFFNPAPVLNLVEVIEALSTSEETVQFAFDFAVALGKEPVRTKDKPGFIVNRILVPMLNEAVFALEEGVGSPEDIDKALKLGAAHPIGPLALIDLIGLDITLDVMDVLHGEFGDSKFRAAPLLRQMVRAGWLGRKTKKGFYEY